MLQLNNGLSQTHVRLKEEKRYHYLYISRKVTVKATLGFLTPSVDTSNYGCMSSL